MTDKIRLTIDPEEAQLEFDRPSVFTVTVQNLTEQVDAFDLSVVGLSPQYARFDPPRLSRFPAPERSAAAKLTVTIPSRAKVPARRHVIGVKAQSAVDARLSRVEEVRVDFPAVEDLVLEPVPMVVTSGGTGRFRIRAVNRGSVPKQIQLTGTDSEAAVNFAFDPTRLLVPPFGAAEAAMRVKARRPLSGGSTQRTLIVRSIDTIGQVGEAQASFVQRPLFRKPVIRLGAFAAVGAAAVATFLLTRPQPITVEDYVGQAQDEVEVALGELGLQVELESEPSEFVSEGLVIETLPPPGAEVDAGGKIKVIVSTGPALTAVPPLKGLTPQEVDERLAELQMAGFEVRKTTEDSTTVPRGQVIRTSPLEGDEIKAGSRIEVFMSDGVEVPGVVGQNVSAALDALAEMGLTGIESATQPTTDESRNGEVIRQDPPAGTRVSAPERQVFLTVNQFGEPPDDQPPPESDE